LNNHLGKQFRPSKVKVRDQQNLGENIKITARERKGGIRSLETWDSNVND